MKNYNTKKIVQTAVFAALAAVLTIFPQVPTGTGGYVHFGDSIIYIAAMLLGPIGGCISGAIGHAMADLISGYAIFALPTFIIKGIMGYVTGKILYKNYDFKHITLAMILALIIQTLGYFIAEIPLYGLETAAIVFISSPIQWLMSVIAFCIMLPIIKRIKYK